MTTTKKPTPQQEIPNSIKHTAQLLEKLSSNLATKFAAKLFTTPIKHKLPQREEKMELNAVHKYIDIPSINKKIRVLEYGKSDKIALLVHGWSGRGTQLISIADALLKEGYMTISFDAPAHGKSEGKTAHMALFIACVLELEKIYGKFDLAVGHSLGGMSVMNALKRGIKADKAVIIGSGDVVYDIFKGFVYNLGLKSIIADKLKDKFEKKLGDKLANFDVFEAAKSTEIPVFVIHDKQDRDVPVSCAENIHKHLPIGKIMITDGLGHRKILGDKVVISNIIDFIKY
jgi:pimeloyl-ACP methyl ester carboxylesterase